ncbi:MAG TPA: tetratricopeptide repeat protein [Gemmatimonadales bacterium]|jgi:Flp pilus assembly protein TadD|nr:tetratricopeptide repeat protein [Gemmatimonadales bacterium]
MSYQFELDRSNRSLRFPVIMMAVIVSMVVAAYVIAACSDHTPDQARASEARSVSPSQPATNVPVTSTTGEKPSTLVISGPVTFEMADSAYRDRRYDDATTLFKSYTDSRPNNAWGFYMLGLSAWKSGDRAQAESAFVQSLALDSTHVKSHLNLSRVLLEDGQPDSALVHIEQAIALDSTSSEPVRLQGRAFEMQGKNDDAVVAYQRAIELDSTDVWSLNNLGALFIRLERFQEAIVPLTKAVQQDSAVAVFHNNLGMALERTGQYRAAETEYRAAVAIEGTYGKAVTNLQRVQQLKEQP